MGMVLGLSLTAHAVAWVLVDDTDGAVLDHDDLEFRAGTETAGAAARSARTIATAGGHDVDRIRLTFSDDVTRDGHRLREQLDELQIADVDTVPLAHAMRVMIAPDTAPRLALAYGAALAERPAEETAGPRRGLSRRRIAMAVLGAAAAALLTALSLTSGAVPEVQQTAAAASDQADTGWVAVSAPASGVAGMVRKVVEPTEQVVTPSWRPTPRAYVPVPAPARAAVPAAVPHLPAPEAPQQHLTGEWPGPATVVTVTPVPVDMTDPANMFTALP
ncbi:hypothetical protein ACTWP6_08105 [Mycobacterium sp. 4D054]|uniref:hypothetical protein n=1 Tax=Mycobacterium sp. 4D054 TaxID=3457440 RepID=UPI003FCF797D